MLFPSLVLDRALRTNITSNRRVPGVDIADGGKDTIRAGVMDDGVLSEVIEIPVDPASTVDTAEQTALGIIKIAQQRASIRSTLPLTVLVLEPACGRSCAVGTGRSKCLNLIEPWKLEPS